MNEMILVNSVLHVLSSANGIVGINVDDVHTAARISSMLNVKTLLKMHDKGSRYGSYAWWPLFALRAEVELAPASSCVLNAFPVFGDAT